MVCALWRKKTKGVLIVVSTQKVLALIFSFFHQNGHLCEDMSIERGMIGRGPSDAPLGITQGIKREEGEVKKKAPLRYSFFFSSFSLIPLL